ncbi:hypothetical protein BD413DRAFT_609947 [Trametes elegans]|nr:hypothetical protein BD413DRAFT_609947 [Trametes elegans]
MGLTRSKPKHPLATSIAPSATKRKNVDTGTVVSAKIARNDPAHAPATQSSQAPSFTRCVAAYMQRKPTWPPKITQKKSKADEFQELIGELQSSVSDVNVRWTGTGEFKFSGSYAKLQH